MRANSKCAKMPWRAIALLLAGLWLQVPAGGVLQDLCGCRAGVLRLRGGGAGVRESLTRLGPRPATRLSIADTRCLHLGHARAALLNDYIARSCNGSLLVRFEDAQGGLPGGGEEDAVLRELALTGVRVDQTSRASECLHVLVAACERAIREGRAYVEEDEAGGSQKKDLASRSRSVADNLARWTDMIAGRARYCVRARLDTGSPNRLMRDPILFYCPASSPQRAEDQSPCCPSVAFSSPVLDHAQGITCVLLPSHPAGCAEQYAAMCEVAGFDCPPDLLLVDRLTHLSETPLSTRFLCRAIWAGLATDYDDPRLPTVRGLLRQGLTPKALRVFSLRTSGLRSAHNDRRAQADRGASEDAPVDPIGGCDGRGMDADGDRVNAQGVAEESLLWRINRQLLRTPPPVAPQQASAITLGHGKVRKVRTPTYRHWRARASKQPLPQVTLGSTLEQCISRAHRTTLTGTRPTFYSAGAGRPLQGDAA